MNHLSDTHHSGFTLIELILSLVILGIIGAIGALGFTDAVRGYLFGVDNSNIAAKAQAALERITLELTHIDFWDEDTSESKDGVKDSSSISITYDTDFGENRKSDSDVVLKYDNAKRVVTLKINSTDDILVDDVTDFKLVYYDSPSDTTGESTYLNGTTMCIGVTLELTGANNKPVSFNTRVVPMFNLPYSCP